MSVTSPNVIEVTDATFEQLVIEESKTRPVVVDLWAAWCGPCKTLGPILEKVADERAGAFLLAKLDVDANQVGNALLQAVKSQGIPTVVAFRDGQPVSMFIGAYPEQEVNSFVDELLPTEAEVVVEEAVAEEESGDLEGAEQGYRVALEKDAANRDAGIGLGRILADRGDLEEAQTIVTPFLPDPEAERICAIVRVKGWGDLEQAGTLASAKRMAASGSWREALDGMLGTLTDDRDEATSAMRDAFAVLGDDDPLVPEFRRRLSNALF